MWYKLYYNIIKHNVEFSEIVIVQFEKLNIKNNKN